MLAFGIDVGEQRKGLDVVILDTSRRRIASSPSISLDRVRDLLQETSPDIVAIDSPPGWARAGRSREAEREIRRWGITCYATPTAERGAEHPFYGWMRQGFECFRAARDLGYPRYHDGSATHTAIEVFPHASAAVLRGSLPPTGTARRPRLKRAWRSSVLEEHGVDTSELRSLDQVDAALAALTGILALDGVLLAVGDPQEGVIVLPVRSVRSPLPREAA
jgi:predicted nuclease with RNAse H fold